MTAEAGVRVAALVALLCAPGLAFQDSVRALQLGHGGIVRGPTATRRIALEFTGHEFAEGGADHPRRAGPPSARARRSS